MNTPHASQWDAFGDFGSSSESARPPGPSADDLEPARLNETTVGLLGRGGARLFAEIESYLEFFAIARSPAL